VRWCWCVVENSPGHVATETRLYVCVTHTQPKALPLSFDQIRRGNVILVIWAPSRCIFAPVGMRCIGRRDFRTFPAFEASGRRENVWKRPNGCGRNRCLAFFDSYCKFPLAFFANFCDFGIFSATFNDFPDSPRNFHCYFCRDCDSSRIFQSTFFTVQFSGLFSVKIQVFCATRTIL
jgi:hypothetical protein